MWRFKLVHPITKGIGVILVRYEKKLPGDIISTTSDLNRFHRALREGDIISKTSLADMETPTPQSGKKGYGPGYVTEQTTLPGITVQGHTGRYPGSWNLGYYLPKDDIYSTFNVNNADLDLKTLRELKAVQTDVMTYVRDELLT